MQRVFGISLGNSHLERLQADTHARYRAVMIGALHVDRAREAALPLRDVIRHVGNEVRIIVPKLRALPHHAVLVITELGRSQPERAVLFIGMTGGDQSLHGVLDATVGVER